MKNISLAILLGAISFFAVSSSYADGLSPQDYMEIEQLYAQYNWAIDSGDAEAYANTFVEDGVFNTFKGHDQLVGFIKRWVGEMGGSTRKHWNTNLRITGDGKTANGKVYLMLLDTSTQPPSIIASASYTDELVKTAEGWRFTKRQTKSDRPAK